MSVVLGEPILVGVYTTKPLRGFPEGRVKIRMRPNQFVRVYVFGPNASTCHLVRETPDGFAWVPAYETARNEWPAEPKETL